MSFEEERAETDQKQLFWAAAAWDLSCGGLRVRVGCGLEFLCFCFVFGLDIVRLQALHMFSYNQEFPGLKNRKEEEQRCEEEKKDRRSAQMGGGSGSCEPGMETWERRQMELRDGSAGEALEFGSLATHKARHSVCCNPRVGARDRRAPWA